MSFMTPSVTTVASRGIGQFEVLGPLIDLATTGVGLYLAKEKARKESLEADRARRLAEAQAATQAAAVRAAEVQQQQVATQQQLQAMLSDGIVPQAQAALASPTATYVLIGALAVGAALLLRR